MITVLLTALDVLRYMVARAVLPAHLRRHLHLVLDAALEQSRCSDSHPEVLSDAAVAEAIESWRRRHT